MPRAKSHPGCLVRLGASFRVTLYDGEGSQVRFTVKGLPGEKITDTRRRAEQVARVRHAELQASAVRRADGLPGPVKVSQLADEFERDKLPKLAPGTAKTYLHTLARVREFFAGPRDLDVGRVRPGHVEQFLGWRAGRRLLKGHERPVGACSNRTLAKERTTLHTLFAMAERREYRDGNPVARTELPKSDPRMPVILSDEEYGRLLIECASPALYLYVVVLGEAGLRDESEALWLRWEDVDLDGGYLAVVSGRGGHRTKSGRGRHVPMTRRLADAFRNHLAAQPDAVGWVFSHPTSARSHLRGERVASMRESLVAAARRAELDPAWRPHDLRHRRVTTWIAAGKDVAKVREAVGHADLRTTMGYTHLVKAHLRDLVDEPAPAAQG